MTRRSPLASSPTRPWNARRRAMPAWTAFLRSAPGAAAIRAAFERKARAWQRRLSQPDADAKP